MAKKLKKYQGTKSGSSVKKPTPDTKVVGDDLSIMNALRRLALDPKNADNWVNQGLRLNPITQVARAVAEPIGRAAGALGSKRDKEANAKRDQIYKSQKELLQKELKNKYGFSFKKGGSTKSKSKKK